MSLVLPVFATRVRLALLPRLPSVHIKAPGANRASANLLLARETLEQRQLETADRPEGVAGHATDPRDAEQADADSIYELALDDFAGA